MAKTKCICLMLCFLLPVSSVLPKEKAKTTKKINEVKGSGAPLENVSQEDKKHSAYIVAVMDALSQFCETVGEKSLTVDTSKKGFISSFTGCRFKNETTLSSVTIVNEEDYAATFYLIELKIPGKIAPQGKLLTITSTIWQLSSPSLKEVPLNEIIASFKSSGFYFSPPKYLQDGSVEVTLSWNDAAAQSTMPSEHIPITDKRIQDFLKTQTLAANVENKNPSVFSQTPKRVAILSFKNLSGDAALDYIGSCFGETLTTKLANVKELELIERMQILNTFEEQKLQLAGYVDPKSAVQAGKILGVQFTVIGSFQKTANLLKADARLVNVETGKIDAANDVKGNYENIFDLQDELALKLANSLNVSVSQEEKTEITRKPTENVSAYEWFVKGVRAYEQKDSEKALECLAKAIELDPGYADVYSWRGFVYTWHKKDYDQAIEDLTKAITLNPSHAIAYANRGSAYLFKKDLDHAIEDFTKTIALRPSFSNASIVYYNRGIAYGRKSNYEQATKDYAKAIELKPEFAEAYYARGYAYHKTGDCQNANADYQKSCQLGYTTACSYTCK